VASLGCGLAHSVAVLIAARAGQGIAGAVLMPAALGLVVGTFVDESERNKALAAWSAIGGIGATAGLLLGGLVTAGLGWQWVFFINIPLVLAMLALSPTLLDEPPTREATRRIDGPGTVTFTAGLGLLIYAISQGPVDGWFEWPTLGAGVAGAVLLAAFVRIEQSSSHPIVPPRLVRSRPVVSGNATLFVAGMCVDGLLFTLTLYTQRVRGYTALEFGAVTAVMTVCSVIGSALAQRVLDRVGTRVVAATGLSLLVATCAVFATAATSPGRPALLLLGMVLFGLGMGCAFVAGSVAALQQVRDQDAGVAAAVQNISFGLGSTVGVAVFSTVAITHADLAAGFRAAFVAGALVAGAGLLAIAALRSRPAASVTALLEPSEQASDTW
jgi:MFS family permease